LVTADDVARLRGLAQRAAAGDGGAQHELVEQLWMSWLAQVRASRSMGSLASSEDHVLEVATRLAEKIGRKGAHTLKLYEHWQEANDDKGFDDWMRIVVANVVRDYVREQLGAASGDPREVSPKRLLNEFADSSALDSVGYRPPFTAKETARQLLEFAGQRLPADQLRALGLWLEGSAPDELDEELGTPSGRGRDLMRAAVAALRSEFRSREKR
jgi:DNA-directed RNA polymerase specialized sigma24 family protein